MPQAKTFNVTVSEYVDSNKANKNETDNDLEIIDDPIPGWLQKAIKQHKSLILQIDPSVRFKLAKE